jgi:murein DD-endopeptidase MepM/ murein hydrolase activator NlpD
MEQTQTNSRWFNIVSWGVTFLIVAGLLGFAYWKLQNPEMVSAAPVMAAEEPTKEAAAANAGQAVQVYSISSPAIARNLTLKTIIPERPRYSIAHHTVERGDALFRIAKDFNIKPETLLWANYDVLEDDPHSLKPGQELNIPPTDGLLYEWKDGDTIDGVAAAYKANAEDIINWPGNDVDLTDPQFKAGQMVMIPGGWRESKAITLPTVSRGSGTGTASTGGSACGGGPVGSGFIWPAGEHYLSGNDYFPGHLGIDIAAGEGAPVYASSSGVVTLAAGGWNGGYGNVIQIDHGNGYVTLYAHLSQINVSVCQGIGAGQLIGLAGNTGNSFGAHLHFEVRQGGGNINPWYVLP